MSSVEILKDAVKFNLEYIDEGTFDRGYIKILVEGEIETYRYEHNRNVYSVRNALNNSTVDIFSLLGLDALSFITSYYGVLTTNFFDYWPRSIPHKISSADGKAIWIKLHRLANEKIEEKLSSIETTRKAVIKTGLEKRIADGYIEKNNQSLEEFTRGSSSITVYILKDGQYYTLKYSISDSFCFYMHDDRSNNTIFDLLGIHYSDVISYESGGGCWPTALKNVEKSEWIAIWKKLVNLCNDSIAKTTSVASPINPSFIDAFKENERSSAKVLDNNVNRIKINMLVNGELKSMTCTLSDDGRHYRCVYGNEVLFKWLNIANPLSFCAGYYPALDIGLWPLSYNPIKTEEAVALWVKLFELAQNTFITSSHQDFDPIDAIDSSAVMFVKGERSLSIPSSNPEQVVQDVDTPKIRISVRSTSKILVKKQKSKIIFKR